MSQTSYAIQAARAFEGLLADADEMNRSSISLANEEAAAVGYGRGVKFGTLPEEQFELPDATGFEFAGVLVHSQAREDVEAIGPVEGENAELLRRGRIWVPVEEAVAVEDDVYLRHTTNGGDTPGGWRTDADTANADRITQAKWITETAAAGLAILEINYP